MRNRATFLILVYFLITLFCGLIFVSVQQSLRLSANDPQIQIASDVTTSLKAGADPSQLSPSQLDIKTSLSPFVIIYDNNGKAVASSGQLDKKTPVPPKGVFDRAKKYGENKFSWTPAKGVRHAAVVVKYDKGFVLAAKSLKETERRIAVIFKFSVIAWILGIGATTLTFLITRPRTESLMEPETVSAPKRRLKRASRAKK